MVKAALEYALSNDKKSKIEPTDDIIERLLPELSNIFQIYEKGNIIQKHILIRGANIICRGVAKCLEPLLLIRRSMITY